MTESPRVVALVGPTAAGKSELAIRASSALGAEVVSVDSAMVYRGMDIGTDKPSLEDRERVPHHMLDVVDASRTITVAEFQRMARGAVDQILDRGKIPLLVGGSGLYFRAVVDPLEFPGTDARLRSEVEQEAEELGAEALHDRLGRIDPEAAGRIEVANVRRTIRALEVIELTGRLFSSFRIAWDEYRSIYDLRVVGLSWPRPVLDERIDARVDRQIARGLVEEVKALEAAGSRSSMTSVQALGYAQILDHLDGGVGFEDAVEEIKRRTRRFARRQLSWFGADPRVRWFVADPQGAQGALVEATG